MVKKIANRFRLIEVSGGIASGKTTFVSLFHSIAFIPLYEDFKKSPFWEAFYRNPGKYIFETEISFILLHYHQIKIAIETGQKKLICDFSFLLDLAYAEIGLNGSKFKAFECVLDELKQELPKPDLIVYLECDAETELSRIRKRARDEESGLDVGFLDSLNKALAKEVEKVNDIHIVKINSKEKDFANDADTRKEMVDLIQNYFNA